MVLATLVWLLSLCLMYQSRWIVLGMIASIVPGWLFLVKHYEERELQIRFGAAYDAYRARTPFLWPRRPRVPSSLSPLEHYAHRQA